MHRFSQAAQEGAGAGNVFDLGGDLGQWRIDSIEVDPETTRPSELDGVLVQRTIHKTAHTILGLSGAVFKSRLSPRTTERNSASTAQSGTQRERRAGRQTAP